MADIQQTIVARLEQLVQYWNNNDGEKAAAVYHPETVAMPMGSPTQTGRETIKGHMEALIASGMAKIERTSTEVEQFSPDVCMASSTWKTYKADGSSADTFKDLNVWKKIGGDWFIYRDIFNVP